MKNCISKLTLFAGYNLKLQITNVVEDKATGNVINATAWTQFCDPAKSAKEYGDGKWTKDEYFANPDAVEAIVKMIDVQNDYESSVIDLEHALTLFKTYYEKWHKAHLRNVPNFVEKSIVGLNASGTLSDTCKRVVEFFKDVPGFQMGARFLNTLGLRVKDGGRDAAIQYVSGYFSLQGKRDEAEQITAKMGAKKQGSPEWDAIEAGLYQQMISTTINKRLKIYFGAQGTGKTTQAMSELDDLSNVIVCNASMDSNDMLFDFDFDEDGHPTFKPGKLYKACEEGKKILLDEINLLNDEVLRFLQGITDNKETFSAKGHEIHVKDGFMVIGTMNLTVNGQIFPLPEPLVDRAVVLKEFTMDASMLEAALM